MRLLPVTLVLVTSLALAQSGQLPNAPALRFTPVPKATLVRQEWKAEFEYSAIRAQQAYDVHDQALRDQGWQRVTTNRQGTGDDLEYEAEYRRGNVRAKLQVDQDDGTAEIELALYSAKYAAFNI